MSGSEVIFNNLTRKRTDNAKTVNILTTNAMSETICFCHQVTRETIEKAIREKGLKTVEEVGEATGAGTGCGGCQDNIQEILDEINGK